MATAQIAMKIDFAFERIDHLLGHSVGNLRFIGRAEQRHAHFAGLELNATLKGDVRTALRRSR